MIRAPTKIIGDQDRSLEIEELLDVPLRNLVDEAATAGWSTEEVLNVMEELVRNYRLAYSVDPDPADDPENENPHSTADKLVARFVDGRDLGP